uniref:Uncharacterized protein n=1 Tax=Anguilla anguilla TaxID=7936 RepID=A0A0E9QTC7_ANGAN
MVISNCLKQNDIIVSLWVSKAQPLRRKGKYL